jgi:hypothetical protein
MADAAQRIELSFAERTVLTFGLGSLPKADGIEIQWPSGQIDKLSNVNAGQTITVEEGKGIAASTPYNKPRSAGKS